MTFKELPEEEKRAWRADPMTRAFLETLGAETDVARQSVNQAADDGSMTIEKIRDLAGYRRGLERATYLLESA